MDDLFLGVILALTAAAVCLLMLALGFAAESNRIAKSCAKFGAFEHKGVMYECKAR